MTRFFATLRMTAGGWEELVQQTLSKKSGFLALRPKSRFRLEDRFAKMKEVRNQEHGLDSSGPRNFSWIIPREVAGMGRPRPGPKDFEFLMDEAG